MKIEGNVVTFSTGKVVSVNFGVIGIGTDLIVSAGYDNGLYFRGDSLGDDGESDSLTNEEAIELGKYMIDLWNKFVNEHINEIKK